MIATQQEKASVRKMLDDIREHVGSYSLDDITSGAWLAMFLTYALKDYSRRTDEASLRALYPALSEDKIVASRIEQARRQAALEGAITATVHTTALSAALSTGGAAAAFVLPAGMAAFATDMLFVTSLQLRLAYDMSVLYGRDIDLEDPEDVLDLVRVAFGIKVVDEELIIGEGFGGRMMRNVAEGTTKVTRSMLTTIGKVLFKRTVIKFTLPAASIPLAAGMNYYFTGETAKVAQQVYRDKTTIREAARQIALRGADDPGLVLQSLWLVIRADNKTSPEESWFLEGIVAAFSENNDLEEMTEALETLADIQEEDVIPRLIRSPRSLRTAIFDAACMAATVDHDLSRRELRMIKGFADACGIKIDVSKLKAQARQREVWGDIRSARKGRKRKG